MVLRLLLVALMVLPVYGALRLGGGGLAARLAVAGMLCITLVRPEDGLLLCAAFLPLGGLIGGLLGFPGPSLREPFTLAFLAAWCLRDTVRPPAQAVPGVRALLLPAFVLAAVVAASMGVQLIVAQRYENFPWPYFVGLFSQLAGPYLARDASPGLVPGAVILEGIGLYAAALVLCSRRPHLRRRMLGMAVAGATGVAALNVYRFAEICLRYPDRFPGLLLDPRDVRISMVFADFNAAGSYFAMTVLVGLGLLLASRRWQWGISALVILAALWFSGSRAALAAAAFSLVVAVAWGRRIVLIRTKTLFAGIAAVIGILAFVLVAVPRPMYDRLPVAVASRVGLGAAAVRMAASHPVFGIGVGRFLAASGGYIDPSFARKYYASENAHNNFLQVLAELGLAGFVLLVWLLAVAGHGILAALARRRDMVLFGAACGLLAFLTSCLAGHPLLIGEVAVIFWPVLGAAAARAPGDNDEANAVGGSGDGLQVRDKRLRWLLAAGLACLVISVPIRAHEFLENEADLGAASIGLPTKWSWDNSVRYRPMTTGRAQFYVPGRTCLLSIGLSVDAGETRSAVDVEVLVDGHAEKRVRVVRDSWRETRLSLVATGKRFRQIELRTVPQDDVIVRVGRPQTSDCPAQAPPG